MYPSRAVSVTESGAEEEIRLRHPKPNADSYQLSTLRSLPSNESMTCILMHDLSQAPVAL